MAVKWVLKAFVFSLDLFGHHMIAHFGMPRSIPAHSQYLSNLSNCCWMDVALLDITARSSA